MMTAGETMVDTDGVQRVRNDGRKNEVMNLREETAERSEGCHCFICIQELTECCQNGGESWSCLHTKAMHEVCLLMRICT